jgi:hypothetical protein
MSSRRTRRRIRKYFPFFSIGILALLAASYYYSQKMGASPSAAPDNELRADVKIRSTVDGQVCVMVSGGGAKKNQLYLLQTPAGQADVALDLKSAHISFRDAYLLIEGADKKNVLLSLTTAAIPANVAQLPFALKQLGYGIGEHVSPEYYAEVAAAINANQAKVPAFASYLCKCLSKSISDSQCYMGGYGSSSCTESKDAVHYSRASCDTSFYVCCTK